MNTGLVVRVAAGVTARAIAGAGVRTMAVAVTRYAARRTIGTAPAIRYTAQDKAKMDAVMRIMTKFEAEARLKAHEAAEGELEAKIDARIDARIAAENVARREAEASRNGNMAPVVLGLLAFGVYTGYQWYTEQQKEFYKKSMDSIPKNQISEEEMKNEKQRISLEMERIRLEQAQMDVERQRQNEGKRY